MRRSTKEILKQINEQRHHFDYYGANKTKIRNNIRLLQWTLGIRTRPYPEGEGLMQIEDGKALDKEIQLRKKLKVSLVVGIQ